MLPEYDSNIHAFSTLISITLGNFDLNIFDNSKVYFSKYYGYIYTMLFIWLSSITLLNFLIAIITNVYEFKSKIEVGLYLENIVNINKILGNNKKYSSIVSMVPPLNFITFLCSPMIIWFSNKKLNDRMLIIWYIPVMVWGIGIFVITSLVLLPFVYLIILFKLLKGLWNTSRNRAPVIMRIADWFIFFFCGIFIWLYQVVIDTVKFTSDLFNKNLSLKYNARNKIIITAKKSKLDPRFFKIFFLLLKQKKQNSIHSKKLIKELSKILCIEKQIHSLLFLSCTEDSLNQ